MGRQMGKRTKPAAAGASGAGPSQAAAAHRAEDAAPSSEPFPLLSLPEGLLATHVWPHLGPWACAQLRATCKQLRAVADGLMGPELRVVLTPQELRASALRRSGRLGDGAGAKLDALCALLQRSQAVTSLTLVIDAGMDEGDLDDSGLNSQTLIEAAAIANALHRLGQAAGGRLRRLSIFAGGLDFKVSPVVFDVLVTHFSSLTHLRLYKVMPTGSSKQWDAVLAGLPQSLQQLRLSFYGSHWRDAKAEAFLQLVQRWALELPALGKLDVEWAHDSADLRPLAQALVGTAAAAAGPVPAATLQRLSVQGHFKEEAFMGPLASAPHDLQLASSLSSLSLLDTRISAASLSRLLRALPNLSRLRLQEDCLRGSPELWQTLCSMQHLSSLTVDIGILLAIREEGLGPEPPQMGPAAGAQKLPASLTRLQVHAYYYDDNIVQFFDTVPQHCLLAFVSMRPLRPAEVEVALAHPGGVSWVLQSSDTLSWEVSEVEVPGMISVGSTATLQCIPAARPMHALHLELRGLSAPEAEDLIQASAAAHGGQLHTLGLSLAFRDHSKGLASLPKLTKSGQLPALKRLLIHSIPDVAPQAGLWKSSLKALLQGGCSVHMLTEEWIGSEMAMFLELKKGMPDPDMLQVGERADAHGAGA